LSFESLLKFITQKLDHIRQLEKCQEIYS